MYVNRYLYLNKNISNRTIAAISPNKRAVREFARISSAVEKIMKVIPNIYNGADPKNIFVPSSPAKGNIENIATKYDMVTKSENPGKLLRRSANKITVSGPAKCIIAISKSVTCLNCLFVLESFISEISELPTAQNFSSPFENKEKSKGRSIPIFIDFSFIPKILRFSIFALLVNQNLFSPQILKVDLQP